MSKILSNIRLAYLAGILLASVSTTALQSCSDDDDDNGGGTSVQPIEITYGESYQVPGASEITIDNPFIATASGNTITAKHAGKATATIDGKEYPVVIGLTDEGKIYDDPITEWGVDEAYVKQQQKQGTLDGESPDSLHYSNAGQALELIYYFKSGKLTNVRARFTRNDNRAVVVNLTEHYNPIDLPEQYYTNVGDRYFVDAANINGAKTIAHWAEITSWAYAEYYDKASVINN